MKPIKPLKIKSLRTTRRLVEKELEGFDKWLQKRFDHVLKNRKIRYDETDVDRYLESMREALMEEIRKGKRIQI